MNAELLSAWGPPILSIVFAGGIGGLLKILFDRKLTRAMTAKTTVEGEVTQSTDDRAWVELARQDAINARNEARESMKVAEESRRAAWAAQDTAAACRVENVALRERVADLEESIRDCARAGCPLRGMLPDPKGGT